MYEYNILTVVLDEEHNGCESCPFLTDGTAHRTMCLMTNEVIFERRIKGRRCPLVQVGIDEFISYKVKENYELTSEDC